MPPPCAGRGAKSYAGLQVDIIRGHASLTVQCMHLRNAQMKYYEACFEPSASLVRSCARSSLLEPPCPRHDSPCLYESQTGCPPGCHAYGLLSVTSRYHPVCGRRRAWVARRGDSDCSRRLMLPPPPLLPSPAGGASPLGFVWRRSLVRDMRTRSSSGVVAETQFVSRVVADWRSLAVMLPLPRSPRLPRLGGRSREAVEAGAEAEAGAEVAVSV